MISLSGNSVRNQFGTIAIILSMKCKCQKIVLFRKETINKVSMNALKMKYVAAMYCG